MQFMVAALKILWENRFPSKQSQGQSSPGLPLQATRTALLQHPPLVTPAGDNGSYNFIHVLSYNYTLQQHHFSSTRDEKKHNIPPFKCAQKSGRTHTRISTRVQM